MKLKILREHYQSTDEGTNWVPKRSFNSNEEIIAAGFSLDKWTKYKCSVCDHFHISKWTEKAKRCHQIKN